MIKIFSKKSKDSIKKALLNDKGLSKSMLYAELSKTTGSAHWYRVRSVIGDRVVRTLSEVGGLLVGNEKFQRKYDVSNTYNFKGNIQCLC